MKFLVAIILTAILAFIGGLYFPWWTIAIVAFGVSALVRQRPWVAFFSGFLAVFGLWLIHAFVIDMKNQSLLSTRIGELLGVGPYPSLIILITACIGGLVAGLAASSASFLYPAMARKQHYGPKYNS